MPDGAASRARDHFAIARVAHLATVDGSGRPRVQPCCFVLSGEMIYTAVDAKPKTTLALARLRDIEANPAVAIVVDGYDDTDWTTLWWARARGTALVLPAGSERDQALDALRDKYPQYEANPPPGPVISISVTEWTAWDARPDP